MANKISRLIAGEIPNVAVFSKTSRIGYDALVAATAAIQIQVHDHLKPAWGKDAILTAFKSEKDVPTGYWKVWIQDELEYDVYGYHAVDNNNVPFAKLRYSDAWTVVLSHELVEMLVNPYVDFVLSSEVFEDGEGEEELLVEVADPAQDNRNGYLVNGIKVSDFYLPSYFNVSGTTLTGKYSYTGAITQPKELLEGGYYSFKTRLGEWWQARKALGVVYYERISDKVVQFPITTILIVIGVLAVLIGLILYINRNDDE